jgi:hypothetical protein
VRDVLVPEGFRVVCTSRPEGVVLSDYTSKFVVLELGELSEAQQQAAIHAQLVGFPAGIAFSDHLTRLSAARRSHTGAHATLLSKAELCGALGSYKYFCSLLVKSAHEQSLDETLSHAR